MPSKYKWTIRFSLLMPLLLIIAVFLMGGGHGWYQPAMILFSWGMVGTLWQDTIRLTFIITGILQYTLYGLLIDKTDYRVHKKLLTLILIVTHLVLAGLIIINSSEQWN